MNKSAFFILLLLCLAWPALGTLRAGTMLRLPSPAVLSACTLYGRSATEQAPNQCSCAPGFGWNEAHTSCIGIEDACKQQFGTAATADEGGAGCSCTSGYGYDPAAGTCVPLDAYCKNQLGRYAVPMNGNSCGCHAGSSLTENQDRCVPDFSLNAW